MANQQVVNKAQAWIKQEVMDRGRCTGCSACVGLCPYQDFYRDRTVILHDCDRDFGRCYYYCPRSPTDLDALQKALFDPRDLVEGLGACKGLYVTRASDPEVGKAAQHGGTVSALVTLALAEGLIDTAVLTEQDESLTPRAVAVSDPQQVVSKAKSKFSVSPTVSGFNRASRGAAQAVGIVATPCQALALAKMRARPAPGDEQRVQKLKLVVGLFCGWGLSWSRLKALLADRAGGAEILGLDIPPSKHQCLEVQTRLGVLEIPIDQAQACVRESCRSCLDMTCEFADLSVGSARSPEGWQVDKGWNQVVVRSETGKDLLELARSKAVLEFKQVPPGSLEKLQEASRKKRRAGQAEAASQREKGSHVGDQ